MTVSFKAAFRERDFFLLTLDALRFDVARDTLAAGLAARPEPGPPRHPAARQSKRANPRRSP